MFPSKFVYNLILLFFFIETGKLIAVEQTCREYQIKMAAKLAAIEKSQGENQATHSQHIQKFQIQNASIQMRTGKWLERLTKLNFNYSKVSCVIYQNNNLSVFKSLVKSSMFYYH